MLGSMLAGSMQVNASVGSHTHTPSPTHLSFLCKVTEVLGGQRITVGMGKGDSIKK